MIDSSLYVEEVESIRLNFGKEEYKFKEFERVLNTKDFIIRVGGSRLTEPKPKTGFFGPKTETENRGSKTGKTENRGSKPIGFRFLKFTPEGQFLVKILPYVAIFS